MFRGRVAGDCLKFQVNLGRNPSALPTDFGRGEIIFFTNQRTNQIRLGRKLTVTQSVLWERNCHIPLNHRFQTE